MVLQLITAQTAPEIVVFQVLYGSSSSEDLAGYTIYYNVYDNEIESLNHHVTAYSLNDEEIKIPIKINSINKLEPGNDTWVTDISFNKDTLNNYNIELEDIGVKVIVHKAGSNNQIVDAINNVTPEKLQQFMAEVEGVRHVTTDYANYTKTQNLFDSLANKANLKNLNYGYTFGYKESKNLIAAKEGIVDNNSSVLITAHYDTVMNSPGADDNGSGVCGLLMAMEVLKDYSFEKNIKIVSFDDEEAGLIGSINYIAKGIEANEQIEGVFNLEMIGYASDEPNTQQLPLGFELLFPDAANYVKENDFRGDFLISVGNAASESLIEAYQKAASEYVPGFKVLSLETPGNGEITQDLRRSDHAPFWDNGYQALMLTDGANFRNPFYHTPNDISAVLDFEFMANVIKVTIAAVMQKAKPIVYGEVTGFLKDAVIVNTNDIENATAFDLNVFSLGDEMQIFHQLPEGINEASLKIYNLNGQFLEEIEINSNKGRLSLKINYNLSQFAFVVIDIEGGLRYAKKVIMFP